MVVEAAVVGAVVVKAVVTKAAVEVDGVVCLSMTPGFDMQKNLFK